MSQIDLLSDDPRFRFFFFLFSFFYFQTKTQRKKNKINKNKKKINLNIFYIPTEQEKTPDIRLYGVATNFQLSFESKCLMIFSLNFPILLFAFLFYFILFCVRKLNGEEIFYYLLEGIYIGICRKFVQVKVL